MINRISEGGHSQTFRAGRAGFRSRVACLLSLALVVAYGQMLAPICGIAAVSEPVESRQFNQDVCGQALQLAYDGKDDEAKNLLLSAYKSQSQAGPVDPDVVYFLAALETRDNNYSDAIKYLNQVSLFAKSDSQSGIKQVLIAKRLGDCLYKNSKVKDAMSQYKAALFVANRMQVTTNIVGEEILEGIVACDLQLKNYSEAEHEALLLVDQTKRRMQNDRTAVLSVVWALFQLSDVYRYSNQSDKLESCRSQLQPLLAALVDWRMKMGNDPNFGYDTVILNLRRHYVEELQAKSAADVAWAAADFRERTLPIIGWASTSGAPHAVVLCVHGLGLENRAFRVTAQALNSKGYEVYALDVRGFGTWALTKGIEELDYDQTIADIGNVVRALKAKYQGLPVFVLGESMGGAIVLRAGAALGDQIEGIISSVPSAERFQQKKMTLQTSLRFLVGPKKAFDVGYVTSMATSSEEAQTAWKDDPKARLRLTPVELTEFAVFMRRTKPHAEKIKSLPVLMLQGLSDRLVKPEGTFKLFDAVGSPDKTLYLAGTSEHLMFETAHPDPILMNLVDSWISQHLAGKAPTSQAAPH